MRHTITSTPPPGYSLVNPYRTTTAARDAIDRAKRAGLILTPDDPRHPRHTPPRPPSPTAHVLAEDVNARLIAEPVGSTAPTPRTKFASIPRPFDVTLTPKAILDAVARYYAVEPESILHRSRRSTTIWARHVTRYLMMQLGHTKSRVAEIFHCDLDTVLNSCAQVAEQMHLHREIAADVTRLLTTLKP